MSLQHDATEETLTWPDQKPYVEIIHGVRRAKPMADAPHCLVQTELAVAIANWSRSNHGWTLVEQRCILEVDGEEHTLFPDVAWWSAAQLPVLPGGAIRVPAVLAIEVLSPNDRYGPVHEKVSLYLKAGVGQVWLVDPMGRGVTVHRAGQPPQYFVPPAEVSGPDDLSVSLQDLFARLPSATQPQIAQD